MRAFNSGAFTLSVEEEATDGKVVKEIEHMFFARIESIDVLKGAASMELQEQWGLWHDKTEKNAAMGSIRIRRTVQKSLRPDGTLATAKMPDKFVMTTKIKTSSGDALEVPIEATTDNFKAFKLLAESGMVKHRYHFPIEGSDLVWEVDMFLLPGENPDTSTKYQPWCKIDLEVPSKEMPIPEFPAGFQGMFNAKDENPSELQVEVKKKMQQYLSLPNPYVQEVYKGLVGAP